MNIVKYYSVNNDCYKYNMNKADSRYVNFQKNGPKGLMLHSVGCAQPNAKVFANNWNKAGVQVAVHAIIQSDGIVYQCLPWNYRGWHAAGSANNTHVGVEMAEPDTIRYTTGANFVCTNKERAQAQVRGTYKTAVDLFAFLCKQYKLNPLTDIISHNEGGRKGIASGHVDPEHLWRGVGLPYTMDRFRKDVYNKLNRKDEIDMTKEEVIKLIDERVKMVLNGDGTEPSSWAMKEFAEAKELGITDGSRPLGYATRQEAAIMVKRAAK